MEGEARLLAKLIFFSANFLIGHNVVNFTNLVQYQHNYNVIYIYTVVHVYTRSIVNGLGDAGKCCINFIFFLRVTMVVRGQSPASPSLRVLAIPTLPPSTDHTHTSMAMLPSQNKRHHHHPRDVLQRVGELTQSQKASMLTESMARLRDPAQSWTLSLQSLEDKRAKMRARETIHHPQPVLQTKQASPQQAKNRLASSFLSYFEFKSECSLPQHFFVSSLSSSLLPSLSLLQNGEYNL